MSRGGVSRPDHPTVFGAFSGCKTWELTAFTCCLQRENRPVIAIWDHGCVTVGSKALVPAVIAAVSLFVVSPALADHGKSPVKNTPPGHSASSRSGGQTVSVQGVVQAVSGSAVVVRQLDGTVVSVGIDRKTKVVIDGRNGKIADVRPGFVLM